MSLELTQELIKDNEKQMFINELTNRYLQRAIIADPNNKEIQQKIGQIQENNNFLSKKWLPFLEEVAAEYTKEYAGEITSN